MNVYVLTNACYAGTVIIYDTIRVFSTLEKARQELKTQFECYAANNSAYVWDKDTNYERASVTDPNKCHHWTWQIIEKEIE